MNLMPPTKGKIWLVLLIALMVLGSVSVLSHNSRKALTIDSPTATPSNSATPSASAVASVQPKITWSQQRIEITLSPGESASRNVTLTSNLALQNVVIESVPEIARFLNIQPNNFGNVSAGQPESVHFGFSIPEGTALGTYAGTIHVRSGNRTLPQTLKVVLEVLDAWSSFTDPNLGLTFQYPPSWTISTLGNEITVSNASPDANSDSESLLGICKIGFNTIGKSPEQSLREWLLEVEGNNGYPPPISLTPVTINSLSGLREVGGEVGNTDTVYIALAHDTVLSISLVCGEDLQTTGEEVFQRMLFSIAIP